MSEISQRARELLATVDMIETRPIEWPFSDEQTPPIWRIELDGYCADFEHSEAANNFALAINARIEKALSPLPSGDDLVKAALEVSLEWLIEAVNDAGERTRVNKSYAPVLENAKRDLAKVEAGIAAIASIPGRDEVIEECAKAIEKFLPSADTQNTFSRHVGIALRDAIDEIRSLTPKSREGA